MKVLIIYHVTEGTSTPMVDPLIGLKDFFVCYRDLLEYVCILNIKRVFRGEPALKKQYKIVIIASTSSSATTRHLMKQGPFKCAPP